MVQSWGEKWPIRELNRRNSRRRGPEVLAKITPTAGLIGRSRAAENPDVSGQWRREWDSNPRYGFPYTRFPSVRLKPLGHPSDAPPLAGAGGFFQAKDARAAAAIRSPRAIEGPRI